MKKVIASRKRPVRASTNRSDLPSGSKKVVDMIEEACIQALGDEYYNLTEQQKHDLIMLCAKAANKAIDMTGDVKSSRRVKASRRSKAIRCAADTHNPWAMIEAQKPEIIKRWSSEDYTGTPNTSWDWIFDGVLEDFKLYADDEASADETGATLLDNFLYGDFDEIDMLDAFNEFIRWRDINDYDVE